VTFVIYPVASHSSLISPFYFALLVFFLANILGAAVGYLLNIKRVVPQSYGWKGLLLLATLGVATILVGVWLYDLSPVWVGQSTGLIYPYRDDSWRLWTFGVTWRILVLGDFTMYLRTVQSPRRAH